MSIILVDNFQVNSNRPMDNRFVVGPNQFYTNRSDITYKYTGLRVYDINDSTFPCHINGTFVYQKTILDNIDKFIGKSVYIEYGERSGINEVPFHINTVMLYDK